MVRRYLPKSVRELVHWYERYVSPASLVAGFIADNLVLTRRVDLWTTDALFFFYLAIASTGILLLNLIETGRLRSKVFIEGAPLVPVFVQFAFGGLFSGFLSLYSRSAAYATSWIFVVGVAALLLGNERFVRLYSKLSFQIAILFTTLFSFLIFFLPVVFHMIGPWMFVYSGVAALVAISLFLTLLMRLMPETRRQRTLIARVIAAIFVAFNVLYFTGAIPPLPLSLKDAGVYHSVVHDFSSGAYFVEGEPLPWYDALLRYNTVFHEGPGDIVVVYTSIFAPAGLSTNVLHEWQYYDPVVGAWKTEATIRYSIVGGRDGGYEGYSEYPSPMPGSWRVNMLTQYGALIGQVTFAVESASATPALIGETK